MDDPQIAKQERPDSSIVVEPTPEPEPESDEGTDDSGDDGTEPEETQPENIIITEPVDDFVELDDSVLPDADETLINWDGEEVNPKAGSWSS